MSSDGVLWISSHGYPEDDRKRRQSCPWYIIPSNPLGLQPASFTYSNWLLYSGLAWGCVNSLKWMHDAAVSCMCSNFTSINKISALVAASVWGTRGRTKQQCLASVLLLSLPLYLCVSQRPPPVIHHQNYNLLFCRGPLWVNCLHAHRQSHYLDKNTREGFHEYEEILLSFISVGRLPLNTVLSPASVLMFQDAALFLASASLSTVALAVCLCGARWCSSSTPAHIGRSLEWDGSAPSWLDLNMIGVAGCIDWR